MQQGTEAEDFNSQTRSGFYTLPSPSPSGHGTNIPGSQRALWEFSCETKHPSTDVETEGRCMLARFREKMTVSRRTTYLPVRHGVERKEHEKQVQRSTAKRGTRRHMSTRGSHPTRSALVSNKTPHLWVTSDDILVVI